MTMPTGKKMKVIKLTEETLIALVRGQKLEMIEGEEITTIIPPMYDDTDKFHSAFTLGQQVQRETDEWVRRREEMIEKGIIK